MLCVWASHVVSLQVCEVLKQYLLDSKNRPDDINRLIAALVGKSELFNLLADYIVNV